MNANKPTMMPTSRRIRAISAPVTAVKSAADATAMRGGDCDEEALKLVRCVVAMRVVFVGTQSLPLKFWLYASQKQPVPSRMGRHSLQLWP
jgi:hypothetical protein